MQQAGRPRPGGEAPGIASSLDTELTWAKARGLGAQDYPEAARRARRRTKIDAGWIGLALDRYEQAKDRQGLLDFDDLITAASAALDDPAFAAAIHWRSRHLLIDEFQDVNPAQFALVERLLTPTTTLFCVGDPNQSIYGFNGAEPGLLRRLEDRLAGTRTIVLGTNHRSSPEIVSAAATVLPAGDRREVGSTQQPGPLPKIVELDDDDAEAAWVARQALSLREPGGRWRSMAVLARTNAQLQRFDDALGALGIPTERLAPDLAPGGDPRSRGVEHRAPAERSASDGVALGTFHRSKGLEWPTVFVVGASEGFVPHASATSEAQLDEERRRVSTRAQEAQARRNAASKEIGAAKKAKVVEVGIKDLEKAITVAPRNPAPRLYFAIVADSTPGNTKVAKTEFTVFLRLHPSFDQMTIAEPFLKKLGLAH